jgi:hypothetical protein
MNGAELKPMDGDMSPEEAETAWADLDVLVDADVASRPPVCTAKGVRAEIELRTAAARLLPKGLMPPEVAEVWVRWELLGGPLSEASGRAPHPLVTLDGIGTEAMGQRAVVVDYARAELALRSSPHGRVVAPVSPRVRCNNEPLLDLERLRGLGWDEGIDAVFRMNMHAFPATTEAAEALGRHIAVRVTCVDPDVGPADLFSSSRETAVTVTFAAEAAGGSDEVLAVDAESEELELMLRRLLWAADAPLAWLQQRNISRAREFRCVALRDGDAWVSLTYALHRRSPNVDVAKVVSDFLEPLMVPRRQSSDLKPARGVLLWGPPGKSHL